MGALLFAGLAGVEFESGLTSDEINSPISYALCCPDLAAMEATLKEKGLLISMLTTLDAAGRPLEGEPETVSVFEAMRRAVFEEVAADHQFVAAQFAEAERLMNERANLQEALEAVKKLIADQYESSDTTLSRLNAQSIDVAEAIRAFVSSRELVSKKIREILEAAVSPNIFKNLYDGTPTLSDLHCFLGAKLDLLSEEAKADRRTYDIIILRMAIGLHDRYTETCAPMSLKDRRELAHDSINPLVHYKAIAQILRRELPQQARLSEALINQRIEELENKLTPSYRMVGARVDGYYALALLTGEENGLTVNATDVEIARRVLDAYGLMWSKLCMTNEVGVVESDQRVKRAKDEARIAHESLSTNNPAPGESEMLEKVEKMLIDELNASSCSYYW